MTDCHVTPWVWAEHVQQQRGLSLGCQGQGQDLVIQGQGQDLHGVSSRILEAKARPWGQQDCDFDRNKQVDVAVFDFSKAFDVVPHQRLLGKLRHCGIDGLTLAWIESFLKSNTATSTCLFLSKPDIRSSTVDSNWESQLKPDIKPCWKVDSIALSSKCARMLWHTMCSRILQHTHVSDIGR